MAKGKGKKSLKDDEKVLVGRGSMKWKKAFDVEKKELLDMVEIHKSQ